MRKCFNIFWFGLVVVTCPEESLVTMCKTERSYMHIVKRCLYKKQSIISIFLCHIEMALDLSETNPNALTRYALA